MKIRRFQLLESPSDEVYKREMISLLRRRNFIGFFSFIGCSIPFAATAYSLWDLSIPLSVIIVVAGTLVSGKIVVSLLDYLFPKGLLASGKERICYIGKLTPEIEKEVEIALREYGEENIPHPFEVVKLNVEKENWMKSPRMIAVPRKVLPGN